LLTLFVWASPLAANPALSAGSEAFGEASTSRSMDLRPRAQLGVRDWFGSPGPEPAKRAWQRDKNPTVAMLSSMLLPGLGQLYNEREFWALVAAGVHFGFAADVIVQARLTNRYRTLKNMPIDPDLPDKEKEALEQERQDYEVLFLLHRDNRIQSSWLLGLTILLSGIQSFVDAHLFDFDADAPLQLGPSYGRVNGGALRLHF
jgi:hypothetical protein